MKKTSTERVTVDRVKCLVYGKSGVGKTSTALTLDPKTTLIISAESGLLPLRGCQIEVWEMEGWEDVQNSYMELLKEENQRRFKTIFIDSLTEINEQAKEQIVKKDRPALKGQDIGKVYDDLMTMQDYGLLATRMTRMIRAFRDLPYNIVFTCLEDSVKDELTGAISMAPSINGKLAVNIAGYFDEVFRMVTKETDDKASRWFLTEKSEKWIAKDRSGRLDRMEVPDWGVVFGKISEKIKAAEAA